MKIASDVAKCINKEQQEKKEGTRKFRGLATIQSNFANVIFLWKYLNGFN